LPIEREEPGTRATVCYLRDGRIGAIETYLSDVEGMNAFFI